jgi:hypothetical protein
MSRVVFDPFSGGLSIDDVGTGGGGGGGNPNYSSTFTVANWAGPNSGYYTYTKLAATHGKGTTPIVQIWEDLGGGQFSIVDVPFSINTSGDVLLQVSDNPDLRFNGLIIVANSN